MMFVKNVKQYIIILTKKNGKMDGDLINKVLKLDIYLIKEKQIKELTNEV
jgi:hypothetical protein